MSTAITVYGDSILKGITLDQGKYVVDRREEEALARDKGLTIRNLCRFGATLTKGLSIIQRDLAKNGTPEGYTLLEYGGNDCDFIWAEIAAHPRASHHSRTPLAQFCDLYRDAIALLRKVGARPISVTLPPIHSQRFFDWFCRGELNSDNILSWLGDINIIARWQESYSDAVAAIAREEQVPLIDLRSAFTRHGDLSALLSPDGIHPSRAGQAVIGNAFRRALEHQPA